MAPAESIEEVTRVEAVEVPAVSFFRSKLDVVVDRLQHTKTYLLVQRVIQKPHLLGPEPAPEPTFQEMIIRYIAVVCTMFAWVIVATICAWYYHKHKEIPMRDSSVELDESSFKEFKFGLFACLETPEICLLSCCCPAIRWSYTMSLMSFLGFWLAFAIVIGLEFLGHVTQEFLIYAVMACIMSGFRQELRQKFNMAKQGGFTYAEDCMVYFCCMFCAVTQEARHVEEAFKAGHPAVANKARPAQA